MKRNLMMCVLFLATSALAAHALPRGYKEDFNGCSQQSASPEDRQRCCMETFKACDAQCQKDFADKGDYNGAILCGSDCVWAHDKCKNGQTVAIQPGWPGRDGAIVHGLTVDGDKLLPAKGYDVLSSHRAELIELTAEGIPGDDACTAFVVACACPAGTAEKGQECRAARDHDGLACRICKRGETLESCKPCPDCRPELLSAQRCTAPDLPKRKYSGSATAK